MEDFFDTTFVFGYMSASFPSLEEDGWFVSGADFVSLNGCVFILN